MFSSYRRRCAYQSWRHTKKPRLQIINSKDDYFAALHGAFHRGSVILRPSGVRIAEPIHCLAAIDDGGVDTSHVLVVLGEDAEATVLTELLCVEPLVRERDFTAVVRK